MSLNMMGFTLGTFLNKLVDMVISLPLYVKEGKPVVNRNRLHRKKHRSVTIANKLYDRLKRKGVSAVIEHRDIDRDDKGV